MLLNLLVEWGAPCGALLYFTVNLYVGESEGLISPCPKCERGKKTLHNCETLRNWDC